MIVVLLVVGALLGLVAVELLAAGPNRRAGGGEGRSDEPALVELGRRWLSSGNLPVKLGVVISLLGVGFLLKEAVDREWLHFPIELRLIAIALAGVGLLGLGWRLRQRRRTYALSIQGGGVAILYLTTYAAFALYGLLAAGLAFGLLVLLTAVAVALAVAQDAKPIAVLGIIGGFLAPLLVSDTAGDHVALFGYYVVLNVAVLGVAWFKAWRELNLLGFLFTFAIGSLWGYHAYVPAEFTTTEPFLIVFFLMYAAIGMLSAGRQPTRMKGWVDGTLVFGTPLLAFALQAALLADTEYGLAISASVLAAFYAGLAALLTRYASNALRTLTQAYAGLAIAFLAMAIPLALDAQWTAVGWAMQGAALVWLGRRQGRRLAAASGCTLQLAAGMAFLLAQATPVGLLPVLNGRYLTALLIAVAGGFSAWAFDRDGAARWRREGSFAAMLLCWSAAWWFGAGLAEIAERLSASSGPAAALALVALSGAAAMPLAKQLDWPRLNSAGLLLLPAMVIALLGALPPAGHPLEAYGLLAWSLALVVQYAFLRHRALWLGSLAAAWHIGVYWLLAGLLGAEVYWQIGRVADGVWPAAGTVALLTAIAAVACARHARAIWPFAAYRSAYLALGAGGLVGAALLGVLGLNLGSPGDPLPLHYLPLVNPLELASVAAMALALRWLAIARAELSGFADYEGVARPAVAALGFIVLTMAIARLVHHWGGVAFSGAALLDSDVFQVALSVVWGLLALAGMLIGARRLSRGCWFSGAALMGVVVVKLFLVELANTTTLARAVSFIAVGALLLVVGYFAPVPPRDGADQPVAP